MFDEYDEGTAVMPMSDDPPSPPPSWGRFITNEGRPADWWMLLTGQAREMLLGRRPTSSPLPTETELAHRADITPGDANGDGSLDLSDALAVLFALFGGSALPCGDGSLHEIGNLRLIDWQPDGALDISDGVAMLRYLFLGETAHPLAPPGAALLRFWLTDACFRSNPEMRDRRDPGRTRLNAGVEMPWTFEPTAT